jgi:phosphatidylethanolamine-binding protein (PEBP) family uncharacterized protein
MGQSFIMTLQIVLIIIDYDACRSEEFTNMMVGDIEHKSNMLLVSIPKIKTNTPGLFGIPDALWIHLKK